MEIKITNYHRSLERYQGNLDDAQVALKSAQEEKPLRVWVAGVGFVWQSDPEAIADAEEDVNYYQGLIDSYKEMIATAEKQISDLNSKITSLENDIKDLQNRIEQLK